MSADQPAEADTKLIIYARSNECTCEYGTFTGKKQSDIQAKSKANIQANRIVQSCHAELLVRLGRFSYTLSETVVSILTMTLKTDVRRTTVEVM